MGSSCFIDDHSPCPTLRAPRRDPSGALVRGAVSLGFRRRGGLPERFRAGLVIPGIGGRARGERFERLLAKDVKDGDRIAFPRAFPGEDDPETVRHPEDVERFVGRQATDTLAQSLQHVPAEQMADRRADSPPILGRISVDGRGGTVVDLEFAARLRHHARSLHSCGIGRRKPAWSATMDLIVQQFAQAVTHSYRRAAFAPASLFDGLLPSSRTLLW